MVEFSARQYLGEVLPTLIDPQAFRHLSKPAVVQFLIIDREDSNYSYRLSAQTVEVAAGVSEQADLTLAFYEEDLTAFSRGTLDTAKATKEGRLKLYGDEHLLTILAGALSG